jgi:hypothetical protein
MNYMPIDARPGTKVVFAYPDNGTEGDKRTICKLGLMPGQAFTVKRTEPHGFHTNLFLAEFPETPLNTVNFALAEE